MTSSTSASLGYVLAHQVAKAEAVAAFGTADGEPDTYWASLVTYPDSGIKTVAEIKGHSFAFSDRPRPQVICTRPTVCGRTGSTPTRT